MSEHKCLTRSEREQAQARCGKATPGEWSTSGNDFEVAWCGDSTDGARVAVHGNGAAIRDGYLAEAQEDADFIAHARTDLPAALADIRHLRELVGELADALDLVRFNGKEHPALARARALEEE